MGSATAQARIGQRRYDHPRVTRRILSSNDLAAYRRDGFLLLRGFFPAAEIDLLRRAAKEDCALDAHAFSRGDGEGGQARLSLWNHPGDSLYGMFARSASLVREALLEGEVYHYHSKMIMKDARVGGAWAWHQDYGYWYQNGVLFPLLTSAFIAVDAATKENGCLQVIAGSHELGRIDHVLTGEQAGADMDQILAKRLARETQLGSLEMSMDLPANAGACTGVLSCAYTHTISWRSATQPLPMEWNPRVIFERLFGDSGSTDVHVRAARLAQQKSILDAVSEKLNRLRRELGAADRGKVEQYTESVRDIERRIQRAESQRDTALPSVEQPAGAPPVFEDHLALMLDLQVLAFQADLTRVITFMLSKEQSARAYPQIGVPEAHHPLSHHENVPELVERMSRINRYHTELFGRYLARLKATQDGDGSLLDHLTILYGSGISNSTRHSGDNLPLLVLGGGAGKLKGGRHIRYAGEPGIANLLVTLMDKLDVPVDHIGGSTGPLAGL